MRQFYAVYKAYALDLVRLDLCIIFACAFFGLFKARVFLQIIALLCALAAFFGVMQFNILIALAALFFMLFYAWRREKSTENLLILLAFSAWLVLALMFMQFGVLDLRRMAAFQIVLISSIAILCLKSRFLNLPKLQIALIAACAVFFAYSMSQFVLMRVKIEDFKSYIAAQKAQFGEEVDIIYPAAKFHNDYFMIDYFKADLTQGYFFQPRVEWGIKSLRFE